MLISNLLICISTFSTSFPHSYRTYSIITSNTESQALVTPYSYLDDHVLDDHAYGLLWFPIIPFNYCEYNLGPWCPG